MSSPNTSVEERDKLLSSTNDNKYSTNIEANLPNTEKDTKTSDKVCVPIFFIKIFNNYNIGNNINSRICAYANC